MRVRRKGVYSFGMSKPLRFLLTWVLVCATYIAMLAAYRLGMSPSLETLRFLLTPFTVLNAAAITLTIAIPLHLLRNEPVPEHVHQNEPSDGELLEETVEEVEPVRPPVRTRTHDVWLWLLFVLLITAGPFVLLFQMQSRATLLPLPDAPPGAVPTEGGSRAPSVSELPEVPPSPSATSSRDSSLLPLYGGVAKSPALASRDAAFVASITERAGSREQAFAITLRAGQSALDAGDVDTAMRRFNQAWLIDASSSEVYRGMAHVEERRGYGESAVALYRQALTLDPERADIACELGAAYRAAVAGGSVGGNSLADAETLFARAATIAEARGATLSAACLADRAAVAHLRGLEDDARTYEAQAMDARSTTTDRTRQ